MRPCNFPFSFSPTPLLGLEAAMRHGGAFERLPIMFSSSDALDVLCLETKPTEFDQFKVNLNILLSDRSPGLAGFWGLVDTGEV